MSSVRTSEDLETASALALKDGYFDGLVVIDHDGRTFKVTSAVPRTPIGALRRLFNPRVRLNVELGETQPIAFEDLRERILHVLEDDLWEALVGIEEVRKRVYAAANVAELIDVITRSYHASQDS